MCVCTYICVCVCLSTCDLCIRLHFHFGVYRLNVETSEDLVTFITQTLIVSVNFQEIYM